MMQSDATCNYPERGSCLLTASLCLALLIEVWPTEADLLVFMLFAGQFWTAIATKAICLTIILAPYALYLRANRQFIKSALTRGRSIAVLMIVSLSFLMWTVMFVGYLVE